MLKAHPLRSSAVVLLALGVGACNTAPTQGLARGQELFETCTPCHMPDGGGNAELAAPAIAGMQQWYVEAQLDKFQQAHRGYHYQDAGGMRMRPMALSLRHEGDIASVAEYVSKMTPVTQTHTVQGDVTAGQGSYTVCQSCHGADGKGNQALNAPSLVDKNDWYLVTQLHNFKSKARGAAPGDTTGAQMAPMAATLADDAAINNVVAYIGALRDGTVQPAAATPASGAASAAPGAALYDTCAACHGADGAGNQALEAPAIGGLQAWYVERQLKSFREGHRGTHADDAAGARMRPMAQGLADDAAIKAVSEYVAGLQHTPVAATIKGDAAAGQAAFAVCQSCHGADGLGNEALNAPALAGRSDWYLVTQIKHFKSGVRGAAPGDTYGAQMAPMAGTLVDDAAINNVVAYISTLGQPPAAE